MYNIKFVREIREPENYTIGDYARCAINIEDNKKIVGKLYILARDRSIIKIMLLCGLFSAHTKIYKMSDKILNKLGKI